MNPVCGNAVLDRLASRIRVLWTSAMLEEQSYDQVLFVPCMSGARPTTSRGLDSKM